jgi:hypothetical protein
MYFISIVKSLLDSKLFRSADLGPMTRVSHEQGMLSLPTNFIQFLEYMYMKSAKFSDIYISYGSYEADKYSINFQKKKKLKR